MNATNKYSLFFLALAISMLTVTATADPAHVLRVARRVPDEYIISFDKQLPAAAAERILAAQNAQLIASFPDIHAYWVSLPERRATALAHMPGLTVVEENAHISAAGGAQSWLQYPRVSGSLATLWGLDRIDQLSPSQPVVDDNYSWNYDGNGVRIYIVDTGVLPTHSEFGSRVDPLPELATALTGIDKGLGDQCWAFRNFTAGASHGTAVAAIAAGNELGVAKLATVVDARAMQCGPEEFTTTTGRLAYVLNWIAKSDVRRQAGKSVVNLSVSYQYVFGDPNYSAVSNQIGVLVDTYNIPVVTAAGNFSDNAYWYGPGNSLRAINVGGLAQNSSSRWSYSNYGYNVAFYAPAQYVESASTLSDALPGSFVYRSGLSDCIRRYANDACTSGTSFAAPHVAGVVARYLQRYPGSSRDTIVSALQTSSSTYGGGLVSQPSGTPVPVLVYRD